MAIAFDTSASATWAPAPAAAVSWSHTVGSGSDRLLLVAIHLRSDDETVSGITFNSVAMTFVAAVSYGSGALRTEIWQLVNPDTGSHGIVATLVGTVTSTGGGSSMSFSGVDQTTPIGNTNTGTQDAGGGTSITTSLTTAQGNSWVVDAVTHRNDIDITAGGSQANVLEHNNGTSTIGGMSTRATTSAGSYSMSWSDGADHQWRHVLAEVRDAAGGGGGGPARRVFLIG